MQHIPTDKNIAKKTILEIIQKELADQNFKIVRFDFERPWGGFFVIDETQAADFVKNYFPNESTAELIEGRKVSPKILIVAPEKRLSWQYHHRRSEVWRVVGGEVGIVRSFTDEQGDLISLDIGDKVILAQGERHRLVGLENYGLVAEIWQHTNPENPSDENDIIRLQDDFGR